MAKLSDMLDGQLAEQVSGNLDEAAKARVSALLMARSVMPDSDVYDRIRLARWIVTGREDEPKAPGVDRIEVNETGNTVVGYSAQYPHPSGDVMVLGPQVFANTVNPDDETVICWEGRNFVPQQADDVPPPMTEAEPEPAPAEGEGWQGHGPS